MKSTIVTGANAGGGFQADASLVCAYHAVRTLENGDKEKGLFFKRKWLADRAAFNYCPSLGWAYEFWFDWGSR